MAIENWLRRITMLEEFDAVYRDGVFVPKEPCDLANNTEVRLKIGGARVQLPLETDPAERQRILEETLARMRANPIPAGAPKFTREQLNERR